MTQPWGAGIGPVHYNPEPNWFTKGPKKESNNGT